MTSKIILNLMQMGNQILNYKLLFFVLNIFHNEKSLNFSEKNQNKILSTWADKFSQHPFSSSFTSLGELKLRMYRQGWEWASWLKDHRPNFTHVGSDIDGHQKNGDCNYQLTHSSSKHVDARIIQMTAWWKDALVQSAFA